MVLGTSSHVGKSLLVTALCRIFARRGVRVAPFKSQNMSLNSSATVEGLEIGRAQALQAEAAGVVASVDMNPILMKPSGDQTSQIVVRGKIWGTLSAADYHLRRVTELMPVVRASYEALAEAYDVVILEGAGSPAEINLKQHDIVNMRMAEMADARCLLVGDIDRGGVFASLFGTVELLETDERARIAGFAINKFRGDVGLLEPGVRMIEERLAKPCLGVVPYLPGLALEEEDSLGLPVVVDGGWPVDVGAGRGLRVAVVALASFSNFTDFDALRAEPSVCLRFCRTVEQLREADVIVLPGSKQTVDDLLWLRASGIAEFLVGYAARGLVVGICGGMQMLGETIDDPMGMERVGEVAGCGLLGIRTVMQERKVTCLTAGAMAGETLFGQSVGGTAVAGYEIHIGETTYREGARPFAWIEREGERHWDGCVAPDGRVWGTYLHGVFDQDGFRHAFLKSARAYWGLAPVVGFVDWKGMREESLERLADAVEGALDMKELFGWVGLSYEPGDGR